MVARNSFLCQKNGKVVVDPKDPFANDQLNQEVGAESCEID